jgi:hypothetical protein
MGGLLIADAARDIAANTREGDPMWPRVVGVIAFDTPVSYVFVRQTKIAC